MSNAYTDKLKTEPTLTVVSVSNTVDTEHIFQPDVRGFTIRCNDTEDIRFAYVANEADDDATGQFMLLRDGEIYWEERVSFGLRKGWTNDQGEVRQSIFFHAPDAAGAVDVAVVEWS